MAGKIDGVGIAATAIGGVLVYGGIRGFSFLSIVENLVTGKPITTGLSVTDPLSTPSSGQDINVADSNGAGPVPTGGNQSIGQQLASQMGWEGADWQALVKLWNQESSWNNKAKNPSSGAYGIPQALPYSKMPKKAWPESAGGQSDATTQIQWGLSYIKGRYGNPQMAWAHEQKYNWY
jgi:hypothetical protein